MVDHVAAAAKLFEREGVDAIRELEKKKREQIHSKQEEMKETVGSRYRDIIESADAIAEIQHSCRDVMDSVDTMGTMCTGVQASVLESKRVFSAIEDQHHSELCQLVAVGAQVKFMLGTPSYTFTCVENGRMLDASIRFHSTAAVHAALQTSGAQTLSLFPWLDSHWEEVQAIQQHIGDGCRRRLHEAGLPATDYAEALAALILVEHLTALEALGIFMAASKQWLHESVVSLCSERDSAGLEGSVRKLAGHIAAALCIVDTVFVGHVAGSGCLLGSLIENAVAAGVVLTSSSANTQLSQGQVQDACGTWITDLKSVLATSNSWLQQVSHVSDLHVLARAIDKGISVASEQHTSWEDVWNRVIGWSVQHADEGWCSVFRPSFGQRAKEIISAALDCADFHVQYVEPWLSGLQEAAGYGCSGDIGRHMWAQQRNTVKNTDAISCSPFGVQDKIATLGRLEGVEHVCATFDNRLRGIWNDAVDTTDDASVLPDLRPMIQEVCCQAMSTWLDGAVYAISNSLREVAGQISFAPSTCLACDGILQQNATLRTAVSLARLLSSIGASAQLRRMIAGEGGDGDSANLEQLQENISQQALALLELWVVTLVRGAATALEQLDNSALGAVHEAQRRGWQEVSVGYGGPQDGTAEDEEVFQLPGACSPALFQFLFSLCRELHRAGSHAIDRLALNSLRRQADHAVSGVLQDAVGDVIAQHGEKEGRVLQLLFDIRFVVAILRSENDAMANAQTELIAELDPVDWCAPCPRFVIG